MLGTKCDSDELKATKGNSTKVAHPKLTGRDRSVSLCSSSRATRKKHNILTSKVPHLCILPRPRLCEYLARRNAPQVFGDVSALERILAGKRGRRRARWRSLGKSRRRGGKEAALGKAYVVH